MKYKIGDIVKVREDLKVGKDNGNGVVFVTVDMAEFAGKLVTIDSIDGEYYHIEEDDLNHYWIDEFFEDEDKENKKMTKHYNVGDKVQVRKDLMFDMRVKDGKYDRWVGERAEYTGKWVTIRYFDERDNLYLIEEDEQGQWWWDCLFVGHEHDDTIDDIMRTLNDDMKDEIVREVLRKADNVSMEDKPSRGLISSTDNKYICNTVTKTTRKMEIEIGSEVIEVECEV